ncbi:hypothetical protein CSUI_011248, partial [Cystoisospora suis]
SFFPFHFARFLSLCMFCVCLNSLIYLLLRDV